MMNERADRLAPPEGDPAGQTGTPPETQQSQPGDMQTFLGRQLRAVYDDIARQPVPDRFLELMAQLEVKTAK